MIIGVQEAGDEPRPVLAELLGADYSGRAITPQRSDTAPKVVRAALARFAPFDARFDTDLAGDWCVVDHGNAGAYDAPTWEEAVARIERLADVAFATGRFVVTLGGDHSVTWPLVTSAARAAGAGSRLGVLQLDVHHDVRSLEDGPSNGTPMRGLIESGVIAPSDLVQLGIHPFANRAPLKAWCDEQGIARLSLDDIAREGPDAVMRRALQLLDTDSIYLTVDIDVLDRAFAPGTAAALPGGLDPRTLVRLVEVACEDPRVIAIDVVEFDPTRDVASVTAYAAANVVLAALATVARRQHPDSGPS